MSGHRAEMRRAVRAALKRGWVEIVPPVKRRFHHYKLRYLNGEVVVGAFTPSDHRALQNFISSLKRVERNALLVDSVADTSASYDEGASNDDHSMGR